MSQTRVDEITRIAETSRDLKSFYQHFLAYSARMSGAKIGIAWQGTQPPFQPVCQIQAESSDVPRLTLTEQRHNELLQRSAENKRSFIVLPEAQSEAQPPLLFGSIRRGNWTEVVEFVLPIDQDPATQRETVRLLDTYCEIAATFRDPAASESNSQSSSQPHVSNREPIGLASANNSLDSSGIRPLTRDSLDQYTHQIHRSIDDKVTMANVANETQRLLDCDRVSVLVRKGRGFQIASISGQPSVNHRSNTVKLLKRLASATLKTGQRFWYPASFEGQPLPPQIEGPLEDYLSFAATRSLAIIPIEDQAIEAVEADAQSTGQPQVERTVIAGIVVEQCNEQWDQASVGPAIDTLVKHAADAIRNSLSHRSLFLYPLWRLLGHSRLVATVGNLPKSLAVLAGLIILTLALIFVPANFTLPANGVMTPNIHSRVYAETAGKVDQIQVSHGDSVETGQLLVKLQNEDIDVELETVNAEIERQQQRLAKNRTMRAVENGGSEGRATQTQDNVRAINAMLLTLEKRRQILSEKAKRLSVVSPIDGSVITWDVQQRLANRPVSPGEMMLEVMSVDGDWQLELQLADRRVGHLLRAMDELKCEEAEDKSLKVSYLLEADPSNTFYGRVREVSQVSQLTADQQQTIRVLVDVDPEDIKDLKHVRTGVSAKLHCGKRSLGYVWLHDIYEFWQANVAFRLW